MHRLLLLCTPSFLRLVSSFTRFTDGNCEHNGQDTNGPRYILSRGRFEYALLLGSITPDSYIPVEREIIDHLS